MSTMTTLASATRDSSWDLPLFVHVLGAMILVGGLTLSAVALIAAWRSGSPSLTRVGFMSLFFGAPPRSIVMRAGAQWIAHKEGPDNDNGELSWVQNPFSAVHPR